MPRFAHWWLDRCFLYIGRIEAAKGVPQILEAWVGLAEELESECPPLWLVGGTVDEIEAMRNNIAVGTLARYEASHKLVWWGYVDAPRISALLLKAYVLVTHSRYEPGGRVVLESMAQGIPVIATPHGFARDLVSDWRNGFLVDYGDVATLRRRMSHFVLQPLLRHAMGNKAQQIAASALDAWTFTDAHRRVYELAVSHNSSELEAIAIRLPVNPNTGPIPRGFAAAYPFESEIVELSDVEAFVIRNGTPKNVAVHEISNGSSRSRIWLVRHDNHHWIVKHAFTVYRKRPMWDRGFWGQPVTLQRLRISGEVLGARAEAAAPLLAADAASGFILRNMLEKAPIQTELSTAFAALKKFHRSSLPDIDIASFREQIDRDWRNMSDDQVLADLGALDTAWCAEQRSWDAWAPMSLRLSWRWLELGLRRGWLELPTDIQSTVARCISEESRIAADEEPFAAFGLCHGDPDTEHFRITKDGTCVLIDCERCHPGFFGHDWAVVVLEIMSEHGQERATAIVRSALWTMENTICSQRALLSWLRLTTLLHVCRTYKLLETEELGKELQRWSILNSAPFVSP